MVLEILLVEDDDAQAYLAHEALKCWKTPFNVHRVTTAEAAPEFLNRKNGYARAPRPHLALVDLNLPKKPGFVILEEIRQRPELQGIAVMVLSASTAPADIQKAIPNAVAYLPKPMDFDSILELFKALEAFWRFDVRFSMDRKHGVFSNENLK